MMISAALIGVVSVFVGLIVSYHANTSGSATMAIIPIVLFFVVLVARNTGLSYRARAHSTNIEGW
jgi:ABC-type Mn2+/Zn2+ transport system permease subunit